MRLGHLGYPVGTLPPALSPEQDRTSPPREPVVPTTQEVAETPTVLVPPTTSTPALEPGGAPGPSDSPEAAGAPHSSALAGLTSVQRKTAQFHAVNVLELLEETAPLHMWRHVLSAALEQLDADGSHPG